MDVKVHHVCVVCGETSDQVALHYTRLLCNGCRAFFKRTVQGKVKIPECKSDGQCIVNHSSRKACKACRYDACMRAGVDSSKVQQPREGSHDTSLDETQLYIQQQKMLQEGRPDLASLNWSTHLPSPQQPYIPPPHYLQAPQATTSAPQSGIYHIPPVINLQVPSIGIGVFNQNPYPTYPSGSYPGAAPYFDGGLSSAYGGLRYTPDMTDTAFSQWRSWNKGLPSHAGDQGSANHCNNTLIKNDFLTVASGFPITSSYDPMRSYSQESLGLTAGQYLQYLQHQLPGCSNNGNVPMSAQQLTSPTRCDVLQSPSQVTPDVKMTNIKKEIVDTQDVECQGQAHSAERVVDAEFSVIKPSTPIIRAGSATSSSGFQDSNGNSVTSHPLVADNKNRKCYRKILVDGEPRTLEGRDSDKPGAEKPKKSRAFMIDDLLKEEPRRSGSTFQEFCPYNSFVPTRSPASIAPGFASFFHYSDENLNSAPVQWRPISVYPPSSFSYNVSALANAADQRSRSLEPLSDRSEKPRVDEMMHSVIEDLSTQSTSRNTQSVCSGDSYPSSPESGNGFFPSEAELNGISPFVAKIRSEILASDEESQDIFIDCETVDNDNKQENVDTDNLKGGNEERVKEYPSVTSACELSTPGEAVVDSGLGISGASSTATDLSTLPENKENASFERKRKRDNSCDSRPQPAKRLRYKRWPLRQRRGPGYTSTPVTKTALGLKVNKRKCTCACVCQDKTADST